MRSFVKKTRMLIVQYAQAFLILLAFALMVISSYSFVSGAERRHLTRSARDAISNTEANIKAGLMEPETLLGAVSETIRDMILRDKNVDEVQQYIYYINDYLRADTNNSMESGIGIYGVFDVFNGRFFSGIRDSEPPEDYDPATRPWYLTAVEASGSVGFTQPYMDVYTNEVSITFSRRIFDEEGLPLGIIGLDMLLDGINQYTVDTKFVENGYGLLLSETFMIIAHPNPSIVGLSFRDIRSDISRLIDRYTHGEEMSEFLTTDYRGVNSIVFIQKLYNGWYMGVVTPINSYLQSTRSLAVNLSVLGAFFAFLLIWILMRITKERVRSDERIQIMFNATPLCTNIMDKNLNIIDCNENAVKLFGISDKQEYINRFFDLSPEYQSDGKLSKEKANEMVSRALKDGSYIFEWMHQKFNQEQIPCEITLVRVKYKNDYIVVGYSRDLREEKQMIGEIQQRTRLLDTVNTIAAILLANNDMAVFETSIIKCFDLIGHCMDIDRVQIWRNEIIDDEPYFVLGHKWLSDYGEGCRPIPNGLHFPYSVKKEWVEKFLHKEYINAPLCELSKEDQEFFGPYQIKSVAIIPMFLDGELWGFFSIDDCRKERTFSHDEINILTSAGLMMSSAINRNIQAVKMREAEERVQIMIDAAPLCAVFWDHNLKLIDCNQEAVRMFDLESKKEFIDIFPRLSPEYQPDGVRSSTKGIKLVKKALDEGYSRFEWLHQKLDGEPIPTEIICIRVKHRNDYTVTEYIRDLREQEAMIAEMRKAEIAEESSKAKSSFLARMSHEIRTPMNAILGITEIQLQNDLHPRLTREAFQRINNSGDLLLGIINDILDLSKIEAGKLILLPAQYDIPSLIHDTVQLNIMRYESKPIEFVLDVNEYLPQILVGDELRIKQILNNLLSNAFKYTQKGVVTLTIYAVPEDPMDSSKITLVLIVSDTGQGMTPEQVYRLGTEYSRFNMEANRQTEGTGLGMNITRNLIQLMDGSLSIESTPDVGSVFTVRLPQECAGSSVIGEELANNLMQLNIDNAMKVTALQIKRDFMPYGRVLVVDDVETNLYVARGIMAPYGLSIETVISGFEAIDKIKEGLSYDIIFMDHMMPKMDGIEAAKIIRDLGYAKPIVALTANALAGQAEIFIQNGFDDFISKPIDIRQLNMVLNKLVRDKHPKDVVEAARRERSNKYSGSTQKKPIDMQLAEFFVRDAKKTIPVLEALLINKCRRGDDISIFIINVHAMKSALANIGETELSAEAGKLEQAGREQNTKLILSELSLFIEHLYAVVEKLEPKTESSETADDIKDNPYLKEKLLAVKTACSSLDKKTAKDTLAELKQKIWPQSVKEQLSTIAGYLLHSDFDEAKKVIDELIQQL